MFRVYDGKSKSVCGLADSGTPFVATWVALRFIALVLCSIVSWHPGLAATWVALATMQRMADSVVSFVVTWVADCGSPFEATWVALVAIQRVADSGAPFVATWVALRFIAPVFAQHRFMASAFRSHVGGSRAPLAFLSFLESPSPDWVRHGLP